SPLKVGDRRITPECAASIYGCHKGRREAHASGQLVQRILRASSDEVILHIAERLLVTMLKFTVRRLGFKSDQCIVQIVEYVLQGYGLYGRCGDHVYFSFQCC